MVISDMTQAKVHPIRTPKFSDPEFPPMPPRIRLAINNWERIWWLTLAEPVASKDPVDAILKDFLSERVVLRSHMRTYQRICIWINTRDYDEQEEFELSMALLARIHREVANIERVEDRRASCWPITLF
jgi:hypothetical protein